MLTFTLCGKHQAAHSKFPLARHPSESGQKRHVSEGLPSGALRDSHRPCSQILLWRRFLYLWTDFVSFLPFHFALPALKLASVLRLFGNTPSVEPLFTPFIQNSFLVVHCSKRQTFPPRATWICWLETSADSVTDLAAFGTRLFRCVWAGLFKCNGSKCFSGFSLSRFTPGFSCFFLGKIHERQILV